MSDAESAADGGTERGGLYDRLVRSQSERNVLAGVAGATAILLLATALGVVRLPFLLSLLSLAGMYVLLTLGLNVLWGYEGLINLYAAAFWGIGAY